MKGERKSSFSTELLDLNPSSCVSGHSFIWGCLWFVTFLMSNRRKVCGFMCASALKYVHFLHEITTETISEHTE